MPTRYFTVAEANDLVPRLEAGFHRILRLRVQLRTLADQLERLGQPLAAEDSQARALRRHAPPGPLHGAMHDESTVDSPEIARRRGHARALVEMMSEELSGIEALGVEVKDLDTGLCDFTAHRDGRDVLLCWRLGEKRVGWWHELHTGVAGRQPLDGPALRLVH